MRADYDSEGRTLEIELEPVDHLDSGDDSVHPRVVVHIADGRPVVIDVLSADEALDEPLAAVAGAYGLDVQALLAAGRSALAAPDRAVTIEVAAAPSAAA